MVEHSHGGSRPATDQPARAQGVRRREPTATPLGQELKLVCLGPEIPAWVFSALSHIRGAHTHATRDTRVQHMHMLRILPRAHMSCSMHRIRCCIHSNARGDSITSVFIPTRLALTTSSRLRDRADSCASGSPSAYTPFPPAAASASNTSGGIQPFRPLLTA